MARTFSIRSEEIAKFLGTAFLNAEELTIVSPWVSDITVWLPETGSEQATERQLSSLIRESEVEVTFIVSPDAKDHNWDKPSSLLPKIQDVVAIQHVENLHAKAIVTDTILYQGSANITYNGLNINVELCNVQENPFGDTDTYLDERLGL